MGEFLLFLLAAQAVALVMLVAHVIGEAKSERRR